MPLVAAKCTQCGANLQIDSTKDAAICPNCNTAFVTEKAIINYKTYYEYKIEKADVHIHDEKSIEIRLKNAEIFFKKHNKVDKAHELFHSVANDAPGDYRGWWGLVRVKTDDFGTLEISRTDVEDIKHFVNCTFNVAPADILDKLEQTWRTYNQGVYKFHSQLPLDKEQWAHQLKITEAETFNLQNTISMLAVKIKQSDLRYNNHARKCGSTTLPFIITLTAVSVLLLMAGILGKVGVLTGISIAGFVISAISFVSYFIHKHLMKKEARIKQEMEQQRKKTINTVTELFEKKDKLKRQICYAEEMLS